MTVTGHWGVPRKNQDVGEESADLGQGEELVHKGAEGKVVGEGTAGDHHDDVAAPLVGAAAVQLPHPLVLQLQAPQLPVTHDR